MKSKILYVVLLSTGNMPENNNRKSQLREEAQPHIRNFLTNLGLEAIFLQDIHYPSTLEGDETYAEVYTLNSNRELRFLYFPQPWNNQHPFFSVLYTVTLASTKEESISLRDSGLLQRIKNLQERPAGVTPNYLYRKHWREGVLLLCTVVNSNNSEQWQALAGYIKKADSLIVEYLASIQRPPQPHKPLQPI